MITSLYRLAVLALLLRCASALTDTTKRLRVLHELATHPPYRIPEFISHDTLVLPSDYALNSPVGSTPGAVAEQLWPSSSASPATTDPGPGTTESTEAIGRWTPTSGPPTEEELLRLSRSELRERSRILLLTEASSPAAGSPGPAPASSVSTPEHDHEWLAECQQGCPAYFNAQKRRIELLGREAICVPSLAYPMNDCSQHPHIAGEHRGD